MATTGTGQGGKNFQDRQLAAKVRSKALEDILLVLQDDKKVESFSEYKKQMLSSLAKSILPRLNEHTGNDGEPLKIIFDSSLTAPETDSGK